MSTLQGVLPPPYREAIPTNGDTVRVFAVLSTVAITASLAIVVPGSVAESTALASTPQTCEEMFPGYVTAEPAEVNGSYVIDSVEKLVFLSVNQDSTWLGGNFVQTTPIDLEGCLWNPIGVPSPSEFFTGEYDGGGFPIDNLTVTISQGGGLFGAVLNAVLSGINLRNVNISTTSGRSGALAASAEQSEIERVHAEGTISVSSDGGASVGGLVGTLQSLSSVKFSSADVTITASGRGVGHGGLVGTLAFTSTIGNSSALGDVTGKSRVGGLVGGWNPLRTPSSPTHSQ